MKLANEGMGRLVRLRRARRPDPLREALPRRLQQVNKKDSSQKYSQTSCRALRVSNGRFQAAPMQPSRRKDLARTAKAPNRHVKLERFTEQVRNRPEKNRGHCWGSRRPGEFDGGNEKVQSGRIRLQIAMEKLCVFHRIFSMEAPRSLLKKVTFGSRSRGGAW